MSLARKHGDVGSKSTKPKGTMLDAGHCQTSGAVLKEKVFEWWDYLVFPALSCLGLAAIGYFFYRWFGVSGWGTHPVLMAAMTFMLIVILMNNQGRWFLLPWMRRPKPMRLKADWKLAAVTTFVKGAEPIEMLEQTVRALAAMDVPHDTWVLDEDDHEDVKRLCESLGAHHFSRKYLPRYLSESGLFQAGSKHGNYNAWLYEIGFKRYEIITAFDPDHVPIPGFLSHVLGYFNDPKIGYVQAAQAYYNQSASFIARGAAEETYAYYSSVQMAGYGLGYPIVIGCHNTHRVAALEAVGGFAPHDADDLLITHLYRSRGWHGVYVPRILARGLTPVNWRTYLGQQRRWARSVLDLKIRSYPKVSDEWPWKTRLVSLLHGLNYLHKSVLIPMALLMLVILLVTGIGSEVLTEQILFDLAILVGVLQLCELYRQRFYLDGKNEWGLHWRAGLLQLAKWPYLLLAIFDVAIDRRIPYVLTAKISNRSRSSTMMWPQITVVVFIGAAWMIALVRDVPINPIVHILTAAVVATSLMLVLSERLTFPSPYSGLTSDSEEPATPVRGASLTETP